MDFPVAFTERIKRQTGIDPDGLLKALRESAPVSIRINPQKWRREPFGGQNVPWCSYGWYLEKRPSYTLDPLFHAGCYYPQEASGMFTGEAFRQIAKNKSHIRVLDLCGAPGGKSTHLSSLIGSNGVLISNEVIKSRAYVLAGNISRWGIANTIVTNNDPSAFTGLSGYFDIILADVPCSGEGMFRDQVAVREWSVSNTILCSERQRRILKDVWPSLRDGGFLIYCTCTFNPGENEENIKWLTESCKCECVRLNVSNFPGIHTIEYKGVVGYAFYPDKIKGEGFFLSVIKKTGKGNDKSMAPIRKGLGATNREEKKAARFFLNKDTLLMIRENDDMISVPLDHDEFLMLSKALNIIKKGTLVCSFKRNDLVPSHELILSELLAPGIIPGENLEYSDAVRYLRRENLKPGDLHNGWIIVRYNGVNLGLIKNIGQRANNYFPVNWRIRMQAMANVNEIISWKD